MIPPTTECIDAGVSIIRILLVFIICIPLALGIGWVTGKLMDTKEKRK